jgi:omega-6 fatty acid desaturase (delta-12 desaturase)
MRTKSMMPPLRRLSVMERILNDGLKAGTGTAVTDLRALAQSLARFREPNRGRSVVEILITVVPFILLWLSMWLSLHLGYGLYLLLAVPAAGFLVRLFVIQHDCGHGSFFRHRLANDWVGRVIGVVTLTPHDFWRRTHGHATSGNLDHRCWLTSRVEESPALTRRGVGQC